MALWDDSTPRYHAAVLWLVQLGSVPIHVAIMPDGSRWFARRTGTDLRRTYAIGTQLLSLKAHLPNMHWIQQ
ncbi:hypothetical protein MRX96_041826 [Rhipicephalus microplus]